MATSCTSELFVGLAVMVNDWNEIDPSAEAHQIENTPHDGAATKNVSAQEADEGNWKTEFEDMVVDLWHQTTTVVKKKWRICAEMFQLSDEEQPRSASPVRTADEAHLLD